MTQEHPEGWSPSIDADDVEEVIAEIEAEAREHGGDYAAGLRNARTIVEAELR